MHINKIKVKTANCPEQKFKQCFATNTAKFFNGGFPLFMHDMHYVKILDKPSNHCKFTDETSAIFSESKVNKIAVHTNHLMSKKIYLKISYC